MSTEPNYRRLAEVTADEAEQALGRFDDGSPNAGVIAQVEAQLSTTYALLALVDVQRSRG